MIVSQLSKGVDFHIRLLICAASFDEVYRQFPFITSRHKIVHGVLPISLGNSSIFLSSRYGLFMLFLENAFSLSIVKLIHPSFLLFTKSIYLLSRHSKSGYKSSNRFPLLPRKASLLSNPISSPCLTYLHHHHHHHYLFSLRVIVCMITILNSSLSSFSNSSIPLSPWRSAIQVFVLVGNRIRYLKEGSLLYLLLIVLSD